MTDLQPGRPVPPATCPGCNINGSTYLYFEESSGQWHCRWCGHRFPIPALEPGRPVPPERERLLTAYRVCLETALENMRLAVLIKSELWALESKQAAAAAGKTKND